MEVQGLLTLSSSPFLGGSGRGPGAEMGEVAAICYLQGSLHQAERESVLSPHSFCALQQFCLLFAFGLWQKGKVQVFSDVSGSSAAESLL